VDAFDLGGTRVIIRPIRPSDGPALRAAYDRLSAEARYQRFLAPKPQLSESEVRYLVDVDGKSHVALVATLAERPDRIIGVARFVRLPEDPRIAEFAVVIGDPYQRQGLAGELLRRLIETAPANGIERFRATMLSDNAAAHRLVKRLPNPKLHRRLSGSVEEIEVELAA
jgi:RimJ/RimL family protein N-acetyltransferase